ncbi:MAG: twin-arginine translocase subunit TatB [Alphaproteobacteria bacterium]|nr:twin-arginine translocase subunit TatB [Alphaproteobacteria bacterium]MBV9373375.1 twin-arginine translocase subunit TatB [Alphaproteobacteria bacterium]MBV9902584.1 twin-arginine translocase subunit TatB [Alphaproteobacteria bacterium]
MFGVDSSELLIVALVALVVIGPKDLPRVMRVVGQWVGRARGMARHFRSGFDAMMREAELEEMEKKWREENERIMRDHPASGEWAPMQPLAGAGADEPPSDAVPAEPGPPPPQEELPLPEPPSPAETRRELP